MTDSIFSTLTWGNPEQTFVVGVRSDGSMRIIEQNDPDFWAAVVAGTLGTITDYVPPPAPPLGLVIEMAMADMEKVYTGKIESIIPSSRIYVYQQKIERASMFFRDGTVDATLHAEALLRGLTDQEMAQAIVDEALSIIGRVNILEEARVKAKLALEAAQDVAEIDAAMAAFQTSVDAI